MDRIEREKIAAFRFSVIYALLDIGKESRGEQKRILDDLTKREWKIPGSERTFISKPTILSWLRRYEKSGRNLDSLHPKGRSDNGGCRIMDSETELALINLRKEFTKESVPTLLRLAKERHILPENFDKSIQSVYRLLKRHGLDRDRKAPENMLRFEVELPNDLWQSDCMHGPYVIVDGKMRKSFMFAIIDDHSRLITHARFYLKENLDSFLDCFQTALVKRGLPRKLYTDNGSYFRAHKLNYGCAQLGIVLTFAKPYRPEGKGKIERFNRTVRMEFLSSMRKTCTLEELNAKLSDYIENTYHVRKHGSTKEVPLDRYLNAVALLRPAPPELRDYFRKRITRRVNKDRSVHFENRLYEAPVGLAGQNIQLLYDEKDLGRIEVFVKGKSKGFLRPLDLNVNSKIKREQPEKDAAYGSGVLFSGGSEL